MRKTILARQKNLSYVRSSSIGFQECTEAVIGDSKKTENKEILALIALLEALKSLTVKDADTAIFFFYF